MIKADENALICDLAETYNIFDYKDLPPFKVAILSIGLRDDSRIKLAINKSKIDIMQTTLIAILDCLRMLVWLNSNQGAKGEDRPKPILNKILEVDNENENLSFNSAEEFETARNKIIMNIKERK